MWVTPTPKHVMRKQNRTATGCSQGLAGDGQQGRGNQRSIGFGWRWAAAGQKQPDIHRIWLVTGSSRAAACLGPSRMARSQAPFCFSYAVPLGRMTAMQSFPV
eukprot:scaffold31152_cov19-Tisochrysis_lutea.AAC.4